MRAAQNLGRFILNFLQARHFRRHDFHETRDGNCRFMPTITHELANATPWYATAVARWAEFVAHAASQRCPRQDRTTDPPNTCQHQSSPKAGRSQRTATPQAEPFADAHLQVMRMPPTEPGSA